MSLLKSIFTGIGLLSLVILLTFVTLLTPKPRQAEGSS
jgi:hypothetical protein